MRLLDPPLPPLAEMRAEGATRSIPPAGSGTISAWADQVKTAMAAMGLLEEVYRLPMVPPSEASRAKIVQALRMATGVPA